MSPADLILMLLVGIVFGGVAGVVLRGGGAVFFANMLLGVIGASLGALAPVLLGRAITVDSSAPEYMMRALVGALVLVLLASLFRSARPKRLD